MKKLKKTKIFISGKKSHSAEKKLKGGILWDFPTSNLSENSKEIEGGTLWGKKFPEKKFHTAEKNWKGALWSPRGWYGTQENRKNLFGSVR